MNLYRQILMLSLALSVAASGVCFSQAASKKKEIYSEKADAHAEIREALEKATAEGKRALSCLEQTGATTATCSIRLFIVQTWRRYSPPTTKLCMSISEREKRIRT